jgi:transposase InsO family protein
MTSSHSSSSTPLKREEIYANAYRTLEHLAANIEQFIDQYYNPCRLHSAPGYRPPDEFEQQEATRTPPNGPDGATVTFFHARGGT